MSRDPMNYPEDYATDDRGSGFCLRIVGGQECHFALEDNGTCRACMTECCAICGEIMDPGTAVHVNETIEPNRRDMVLCPPCSREMVECGEAEVIVPEVDAARVLNGGGGHTDDEAEDETVEIVAPLTIEEREPIPGLVVKSWRCDGRVSGAEFRDVQRPAVRAIVHGSTKVDGRWQTSYFDEHGPSGDIQSATLTEALRELSPERWELVAVRGARKSEAA